MHLIFRTTRAAILVLVIGVTACKERIYPLCSGDETCASHGQVCVAGRCSECRGDQDCQEVGPCGVCLNLHCVVPPGCCSEDRECETGLCLMEPDRPTGHCSPPCKEASDCPRGRCCVGGRCSPCLPDCMRQEHCEPDRVCVDGACEPPCDLRPVQFDERSTYLTAEARRQIQGVAACLRHQRVEVILEGHADDRLDNQMTTLYSRYRGLAVFDALVRLGVIPNQITVVGKADTLPLCTKRTDKCRARNRRVVFIQK